MQTCSRCLLHSDIPFISFNDLSVCNYCLEHDEMEKLYPNNETGKILLDKLIQNAKLNKKADYDCILGISGGVDSSYALLKAVEFGLNPLVVYVDNGWSSEIAVCNIKNAIERLNVDFISYVLNWNEFRDLLRSFLLASVPDTDIPTDIAIKSLLYQTAKKYKIKYIVTGANFRTEGRIPKGWTYMDGRYIRSVHHLYGNVKLKSYPNLNLLSLWKYMFFYNLKPINILNYIPYEREQVKRELMIKLKWQDYGGKHFESIFTRFNQSNILYKKFKIDKRLIEYSALLRSHQIDREKAIEILKKAPLSEDEIFNDQLYVAKKLKFSKYEMDALIKLPLKSYKDYKTYDNIIEFFRPLLTLIFKFKKRL